MFSGLTSGLIDAAEHQVSFVALERLFKLPQVTRVDVNVQAPSVTVFANGKRTTFRAKSFHRAACSALRRFAGDDA